MRYDESYRRTPDLFGKDADRLLTRHLELLDRSLPVLDIGAGQGRHATYLARAGFTVDAIDPSSVAVETVQALAARENLPIHVERCGFTEFAPTATPYGGVLLMGILPMLPREGIRCLLERISDWTEEGGLILVTAFTTLDPAYADRARTWQEIGRNSFVDPHDSVWTYLEPGEILRLFAGYAVVYHWEGMGDEHRHGPGPVERHGLVEAVLRRVVDCTRMRG